MSWQLGLLLALASAFATNLGFLWRHRGANEAPDVDIRRPLATAKGLFSAKWWSIGFGMAFVAWGLHVASLALAPLSLVQAVLAGGFVILGVLADRMFGMSLGRREWTGLVLTAVGLAFIAVTAGEVAKGDSSSYAVSAIIAFQAGLVAAGVLLILSNRVGADGNRYGVLLGAGAGLLFTMTHISIKALTGELDGGIVDMISPWTLLIVLGGVGGFFASARSLQVGEAVPVIAVTSVASNVSAMVAGVVVFGDPLGEEPLLVAARIAAFALVVIAAAMLPGPLRAARAQG